MSPVRLCLALTLILIAAAAASGAAPVPLIEVQIGSDSLQGRVAARTEQVFWLLGQDGRMRTLRTDTVKKFRQVSPQFSSWTGSVLRDQLRREFGKSVEVVGTRHYTVCARGEQQARAYAETLEALFRAFHGYFSVRGFKITEPEFPLIAIVFPDYDAFVRYGKSENVPVSKNLKGYYLPTSNRIALYDDGSETADARIRNNAVAEFVRIQNADAAEFVRIRDGSEGIFAEANPPPNVVGLTAFDPPYILTGNHELSYANEPFGAVEASLKDTLIHEATHQAAFNTGLHSRIGENPRWVVEGLATVFEAPGIRNSGASANPKLRLNRERFVWFGNFAKARRKPQSLETFLSSDDMFQTDALDAYSQAWALSFFLIETRPRPYAEYLRTIAARDPLSAYSAADRVADFKKTISKELPLLEAEFLRYIGGIK